MNEQKHTDFIYRTGACCMGQDSSKKFSLQMRQVERLRRAVLGSARGRGGALKVATGGPFPP